MHRPVVMVPNYLNDPSSEYSVDIPSMTSEKKKEIDAWIIENIQNFAWIMDTQFRWISSEFVLCDIFYFESEEDKVRFILRWL